MAVELTMGSGSERGALGMTKPTPVQALPLASEMELPEGWLPVRAETVCEINPRKPASDVLAADELVTFVPMAAVDEHSGTIAAPEFRPFGDLRSRSYSPFAEGDVLFAKITPSMENGKAAVARGLRSKLGFGSTEFHVLRSTGAILPEYLHHYLRQRSFRDAAQVHMTGTAGQLRVPVDYVRALALPLPPLAEQERIAAKISALLVRVNAARMRLANVPAVLNRFRHSVLAAAYSGRLTAEWRNRHVSSEPAAALLSRIQSARTRVAVTTREKRQIAEAFSQAQSSAPNCEIDELPTSWLSCRVGAIGTVQNGSTPSRKQSEYWGGDIAWVSSGEVRNNIITETRERITSLGYSSTSVKLLPPGTVLLAMIGEGKTRGQSALLRVEATINQNIAAVLLPHGLIVPEFLWRWFQFQYEATRTYGGGSGPQALNCQRVRELPFVLPPLDEQREVVRHVESLFTLADKIESLVHGATVRAERLPQAILARAFRGELVPTEAELAAKEGRDYEPASALLERIQDLRKLVNPAKRGLGGKKMTKRGGRQAAKSRRPLAEVLREQGKPLTPERLFELAGFGEDTVDEFYGQLRGLIQEGTVRETRPNEKDVTLEAVGA